MNDNSRKTVFITGANRGLGEALAGWYLDAGWRVTVLVRTGSALKQLRDRFEGRVEAVAADLAQDTSRDILRGFLSDNNIAPDLLINNAGPPADTIGMEDDALRELITHFQIHCAGVLRVVQTAAPFMLRTQTPLVVNISSRLGSLSRMAAGEYADIHRSLSYPVAKAAQNMLTIQLHRILFPQGCRVIGVHPGALLTGYGSSDAATPVAEGAGRLARLFAALGTETSGVYLDPEGKIIPW